MIRYLVIAVLFVGCVNDSKNNNEWHTNFQGAISDTLIYDLDKIKNIINLSQVRVDTLSRSNLGIYKVGQNEEGVPGPSDYYIVSTFKINFIDTVNFKQINLLKSPLDENSIYYKKWLPNNVIKNLFSKEIFKELPVYSAEIFYKSPYLDGFFVLQSDSTIYLQMGTK